MTIYKVRIIDKLGKELGECGFYEDLLDAEKRRAEVAYLARQNVELDIRHIEVTPSSNKLSEIETPSTEIIEIPFGFYDLK